MNDMTNKATAVNGPRRMRQNKMVHKAARGLGWFSIGVGMAEILMPGTLARALNMQGREGLLQLYGLREIATGLGILNADDPAPWVWGRVAGDALDLATLVSHANQDHVASMGAAIAAVAGVTVADVATAQALSNHNAQRASAPDYRNRSGFSRPLEEVRGMARKASAWEWPMAGGSRSASSGPPEPTGTAGTAATAATAAAAATARPAPPM